MLFKPDYITRQRQGSSTFSGTFAPAGKVVGAPVKGVGKVGGALGGGVVKGASFLKRGFTHKGSKDEAMYVNGTMDGEEGTTTGSPVGTPIQAAAFTDGAMSSPTTPLTPSGMQHVRTKSFGSTQDGTPKGADTGTASFTIFSATGYPPSTNIQVHVKMLGPKGSKEVHKTKAIKSSSGTVEYSTDQETFKITCSADTQFQVAVKDHGTFGSKDLGEGVFFVSDQGSGAEHIVSAGPGTVKLRSSFTAKAGGYAESLKPTVSGRDSPESRRDVRRSFFNRREASGKQETAS